MTLKVFLPLLLCGLSYGEQPSEAIRLTTNKLMKLLDDPAFKGAAKAVERRAKILEIADERFDWEDIVRRSMGRNWRDLKPAQQKSIVKLFIQFMEASYLENLETHYTALKEVIYKDEKIQDSYAMVLCHVVTQKDTEHPVEFRLKDKSGQWKIYDLKIEGVSMVKNYRSQFGDIMAKSGYDGLVLTLHQRIADEKKNK